MPTKRTLLLLMLLTNLFALHQSYAQISHQDSLIYNAAIKSTIQIYHQNIGDQAAKYNGRQYEGYKVSFAEGHPYFKVDKLEQGTITYDQVVFENVDLLYDEIADCVVMQDSTHRIKLINEKLTAFSILDANFERIDKPAISTNANNITTGFYQVLVKGPVSLYKKETKKMIDKFSNTPEIEVLFEVHHYYYLKKGDQFFEIKNRKSFYSHFNEQEKELTQYAKRENLNFRKNKDQMLSAVVNYYNTINQ